MGNRVLITRPEPSASLTAAKLADLGFSPVLLPISRIVALEFAIPSRGFDARFEALAVTSANAFRHTDVEHLAPLKTLPLFVVGEGTAKAAKEAGFQKVIEGGGDAVHMAATMADQLPRGAKILYLAGRVRQPIFEALVAETGFLMDVCDVYDIAMIDHGRDAVKVVFDQGPFVAVLFYSGVAAQGFVDLIAKNHMELDAQTRFLCISRRVAAQLPDPWQARALIAEHPDEAGIFRLFSKL